jgi:hypothetical protein
MIRHILTLFLVILVDLLIPLVILIPRRFHPVKYLDFFYESVNPYPADSKGSIWIMTFPR